MQEVKAYQSRLDEIYRKIERHEPLTQDDKIDFYLESHRINLRKYEKESNPDLKQDYKERAISAMKKAERLEKRIGLQF